jgi:hypothetical protein
MEYKLKEAVKKANSVRNSLTKMKDLYETTQYEELKAVLSNQITKAEAEYRRLSDLANQIHDVEQKHWFNSLSAVSRAKLEYKGYEKIHPENLPYGWSIDPEYPDKRWNQIVKNDPDRQRIQRMREEHWMEQFPMYKSFKNSKKKHAK